MALGGGNGGGREGAGAEGARKSLRPSPECPLTRHTRPRKEGRTMAWAELRKGKYVWYYRDPAGKKVS